MSALLLYNKMHLYLLWVLFHTPLYVTALFDFSKCLNVAAFKDVDFSVKGKSHRECFFPDYLISLLFAVLIMIVK